MGKWDGDKELFRGLVYTMNDREIWDNQWAIELVSRKTGKVVATYKYERGDYFSRERAKNKAKQKME